MKPCAKRRNMTHSKVQRLGFSEAKCLKKLEVAGTANFFPKLANSIDFLQTLQKLLEINGYRKYFQQDLAFTRTEVLKTLVFLALFTLGLSIIGTRIMSQSKF